MDRVVIDRKHYTIDTLPADLDPKLLATLTKNGITAFVSSASPLSNFHMATIKSDDGCIYYNAGEFYQHRNALFHHDDTTASKICNFKSPYEVYHLGQSIKGVKDSVWYQDIAKDQMYRCCLVKFRQNPKLKDFLITTGDTILVEGNPRDIRWGIGLSIKDPAIFDKTQWRTTKKLDGLDTDLNL